MPTTIQAADLIESIAAALQYMPNYLAWMRTWEWFKDQGAKPEHFVLSGLRLINR